MSKKNTNKKRKKPKQGGRSPKTSQAFDLKWDDINLLEAWKVKNAGIFKESIEPSTKNRDIREKAEKIFWQKTVGEASRQTLNATIDAIGDTKAGQKSLLTYDCMQALSQIETPQGKVKLLGIPVTAPLGDLLSISSVGQDLAQQMLNLPNRECFCLAVMPYYMGCALSPQAVGDIMSSCLSIVEEKDDHVFQELLMTLRQNLLPYSVASHINIGEMEPSSVGTAIVVVAVLHKDTGPSFTDSEGCGGQGQKDKAKAWIENQNWKVLFGSITLFPRAVLEASAQHCQYEWGASARERGVFESVLFINEIKLSFSSEQQLVLEGFIDGEEFGTATLENVCSLWCLDLILHDFESRGIMVEDTQPLVTNNKKGD